MSDLVAGRYPIGEEEWLLDGQPLPPYRRSLSRRDIASGSTGVALTSATLFVVAIPVQAGDIFNFVSFGGKTATATGTHSWVAVYNGVNAGAALLGAQSADVVAGFTTGINKIALGSAANDVAQPGTPQGAAGGPGQWSIVAAAPAVYGVAIYNSGATGAAIDGMPGGSVAGEVLVTGQVPLFQSASLSATATAPAVLPTLTGVAGSIPYVLLSKQ